MSGFTGIIHWVEVVRGDQVVNSDTNLFVFVQFVTLRCIKSLFIAGFRIGMSVET